MLLLRMCDMFVYTLMKYELHFEIIVKYAGVLLVVLCFKKTINIMTTLRVKFNL